METSKKPQAFILFGRWRDALLETTTQVIYAEDGGTAMKIAEPQMRAAVESEWDFAIFIWLTSDTPPMLFNDTEAMFAYTKKR